MSDGDLMSQELLDVLRRHGLDTVEGAFSTALASDLTRPGLGHRKYLRLDLPGSDGKVHELYLKRYLREPLSWRVRRLLTYGPGKSPASVEADNVRGANAAHLPTIAQAYYRHEKSFCGGVRRSYIVLSAVPGVALEHCCEPFLSQHAGRPAVLEEFTDKLAALVAALHAGGYVHRDLYTSHIYMLRQGSGLELHLIDVARMFKPRWRKFRWRVKDLAQLKYSMPRQWLEAYWERFLNEYLRLLKPPHAGRYAAAVERKTAGMLRRLGASPPPARPAPGGLAPQSSGGACPRYHGQGSQDERQRGQSQTTGQSPGGGA